MIFVLGAGKSSYYLLDYLSKYEKLEDRKLVVLDLKISNQLRSAFPDIQFIEDDLDSELSNHHFTQAKVVVSLLPAVMHYQVGLKCLEYKCHLVTASYVTERFATLDAKAKERGLVFLMELGLDPGIDHMTAMQMKEQLELDGYHIKSFKSYCGALIAEECNDNPWHYKFTWNPMNVVLAGQTVAGYINGGKKKYLPSFDVFREFKSISIPEGEFDGYYNRDSIAYREKYGMESADVFVRGTLRGKGFCEAWQVLVDLGFTHHKTSIDVAGLSVKEVFLSFILNENIVSNDFWKSLQNQVGDFSDYTQKCLAYLGIHEDEILPLAQASPAEYLLYLLQDKWRLQEGDRDRIVLIHEMIAEKLGEIKKLKAVLDMEGESSDRTAIAKTVSLPAAIATKLIVENKVSIVGVHIPVYPELYQPILAELSELGVVMREFSQ